MTEAKIRFNEGDDVDLPLAVDLLSALFKTTRTESRVRFRGRLFVVTAHLSEGGKVRYDVMSIIAEDVLDLEATLPVPVYTLCFEEAVT